MAKREAATTRLRAPEAERLREILDAGGVIPKCDWTTGTGRWERLRPLPPFCGVIRCFRRAGRPLYLRSADIPGVLVSVALANPYFVRPLPVDDFIK